MIKSIDILLSPNCNLKCSYCYQLNDAHDVASSKTFHNQKGVAASAELIKRFVKFVLENEVTLVNFYGGEALLQWPSIKLVVKEITQRSTNVRFMTVTNGTLLNEEKLDFIEQHNFNIILSLDGPKTRHDEYRGGFSNIAKCFSRLADLKSRVEVNIQVGGVRGLYEEAIKYVWSEGLKAINVNIIENYNWYKEEDIESFGREYESALEGMLREEGIVKDALKIYEYLKEPSYKKQCGITDGGLAMDWHGDFYPCIKGYELGKGSAIGNIYSGLNRVLEKDVRSQAGSAYTSGSSRSHPYVAFCPVEVFKKHRTFHGKWNEEFSRMTELKTTLVAKLYYEIHSYLLKHKDDPYLADWTEA